jgi:DNA-binding PadR family transcriptional regulator
MLTELEGAILSEIQNRGNDTAFKVYRAFEASQSLEWKASAGAVYPAVKRLEAKGYLEVSAPEGGRAKRRLRLTNEGRSSLVEWACDSRLATSVGIDPFRLRAGIWPELARRQQGQLLQSLRTEIGASLVRLNAALRDEDAAERVRIELAISLQKERLKILDRWEKNESAF